MTGNNGWSHALSTTCHVTGNNGWSHALSTTCHVRGNNGWSHALSTTCHVTGNNGWSHALSTTCHDRVAQLQTLCHPVTLCFCCWCLLVFCCCFCCWCLVVFCCCFCCFSKDRLLGCRLLSQLYLWVLKSNQAIQDQVKSCRASQDQKPLAHWASHDFAFFDD